MDYKAMSAKKLVDYLNTLPETMGSVLEGGAQTQVQRVARLDEARQGDLSFFARKEFRQAFASTQASVVIAPLDCPRPPHIPALICSKVPQLAFAHALTHMMLPLKPPPGIHPTAVVEAGAVIDPSASIGAFVYVGSSTTIGAGSVVHPSAVIMHHCTIGNHCLIYPHVTIREACVLGNHVVLQPGVVIGADGFGYAWTGSKGLKIPQVGTTRLEDEVGIDSLSNVDRAALGETVVGKGSKLDSMVHIGHNCKIGQHVAMMGNTTLAGGVEIGDQAIIYGSVSIVNRIRLGKKSEVKVTSLVLKNVTDGEVVSGNPARPHLKTLRQQADNNRAANTLKRLSQRIADLEKRLHTTPPAQA